MTPRLLILCPGQGSQHAGMFDLARTDAGAQALLARCALPAESEPIFANRVAQPLIVAAGLALWEALRSHAPAPTLVAGYSIGELTAYGVAGMLSAPDAVALAHERARLMDACLTAQPKQTLAAISGLSLRRVAALLDGKPLYVAIETAEDSCIVGGPALALTAIEPIIRAAGGRIQPLPVDIASHTRYMAQAVAPFAAALQAHDFQPQTAALLSGVSADAIHDKTMAVEHLSRQLAEKIRWMDCMDACAEAGVTVALELGPGAALSRMLQARHPSIDCRSAADFRTLDGIKQWLDRHFTARN